MNRKEIEAAARKLDHLGMDALWEENKALREALKANSDALRKALTGGSVKAHEAAEALLKASRWFP